MDACTFDAAAAETWLRHPHPDHPDVTRAEALGVDEDLFGRGLEGFLSTVDDVLSAQPAGLHCRGDVEAVSLWLIPDGDVLDQGALITVDLANGVRLACLHQDIKDFADRDQRGIPAALSALAHIADQVRRLVDQYQEATAAHRDQQPDTDRVTGTAAAPRVVVVHDRDPDASCELQVFVDGAEIDARELVVFNIDPGAGHNIDDTGLPEDAQDVLDDARPYGPAVHAAVTQAYQAARWAAWSTS